MNIRKKCPSKFVLTIDNRLNGLDVAKMAADKLKEANKTLSKVRMPDPYLKQIGKI